MDNLLWYHLGKKRGGGGSGGGGTSVTKRDLLAQTKVDGFAPNSELPGAYARNCYFGEEGFESFEISVGENYTVVWDNEVFKVTAKDASAFLPGVILLGNDFGTGLGSNNEPFAIGWFGAGFTLFSLDTLASHTIHIYQTVLDNAEVRTVGLDATQGSQIIKPTEDGKSMSEAIITMPDTLIPENIAEGVDIGGVIGTLAGGGAKFAFGTVTGNGGVMTITHNLGVVPDVIAFGTGVSESLPSAKHLVWALGVRSAFRSAVPIGVNTMKYFYRNKSDSTLRCEDAASGDSVVDYVATPPTRPLSNANETSFMAGTSTYVIKSGWAYNWFAVGGLI